MSARPPDNEVERLAALRDHQILDTLPAEEYDDLVQLAANVCNVPIAAVTLIDENRQWFKAITGLEATETSRETAFCAHTILQPDLMVVPDTLDDLRFANNPFVTSGPKVRFYAGAPLVTEDGYALGSLCVIDSTPRTLTSAQKETLRLLARQVASHLKAARRVAEHESLIAERESLVAEKEHLSRAREYAEAESMRMTAIVESSEDAILASSLDGLIVSWNKGAERLYGFSTVEMIGQHISNLSDPSQQDPVPDVLIRLRRGEIVTPIEVIQHRKDGTEFHAALSYSPIHNAFREMVGLSCIVGDITERKLMDEKLRESEARFRTSVDAMEEGLVMQGPDGAILFCNESAERILGLSADQMMGLTCTAPQWRAIREDGSDFPGEQHPAMVALREGIPQRNVVMGVHKTDGEMTWMNINAVLLRPTPQQDAQGKALGVVVTFTDITARRNAEEVLRRSQARLAEAQRVAQIGNWEYDLVSGELTWSDELFRLFEMDPVVGLPSVEEVTGRYHPDDMAMRNVIAAKAKNDGLPYEFDIRIIRLNGTIRWVHAVGRGEKDASGQVVRLFGTLMDIHERKLAEERFRVLFEQCSNALVLFDEETGIIDCNTAAVSMMRCTDKAQLLGIHPAMLSPEIQPDGRRSDEAGYENCALAWQNGFHRFEWRRRAVDGHEYPVEVTLTPVTLGGKSLLLSGWYDLTERKEAEERLSDHAVVMKYQRDQLAEANARLEALATTDGLTCLRNHRAFQERLTQEVNRATRYQSPLSVVLLDVDYFKLYNDAHGHPAGDEVLVKVGSILESCARRTDMAARYGGEEFVLILPQTDSQGATVIAERIRETIEKTHWPKRAVTASLGVSSLALGSSEGSELIARADAALYQSKSEGRNRVTCDGGRPTERGMKAAIKKRHKAELRDIVLEVPQKLP